MSSIPQNHSDEKDLVDCVQRFFSKHHVGKLLAKCNGMKEKGISPVSLLRYKLSNIFVGRSKTEPVCFCGIKETVERVLGKRFLKRAGLLLHIHTSSDKNVTEFVTKQRNRRNTFFFHAITSGKKFTDMVFRKKSLNAVN